MPQNFFERLKKSPNVYPVICRVAIGASYHGFLAIWVLNFDHVITWSRDFSEFSFLFYYELECYTYTVEKESHRYHLPVKSILVRKWHTDTQTDTQTDRHNFCYCMNRFVDNSANNISTAARCYLHSTIREKLYCFIITWRTSGALYIV